jgi:hypothetical protein
VGKSDNLTTKWLNVLAYLELTEGKVMDRLNWQNITNAGRHSYDCHFCGYKVASEKGWIAQKPGSNLLAYIFVCPSCERPTFFDLGGKQIPAPRIGNAVKGITDKGVEALYNEARDCTMVGANTAAVLLARKLLMNVAVQHGAQPGKTFVEYIDYLAANGFVPPNGLVWVDQIRKKGNEATHEIPQITEQDARQILTFVEFLLKFVYELPSMATPQPTP